MCMSSSLAKICWLFLWVFLPPLSWPQHPWMRASGIFSALFLVRRIGLGIRKLCKKDLLMTEIWFLNFSFISLIMPPFLFLLFLWCSFFYLLFSWLYLPTQYTFTIFFRKLIFAFNAQEPSLCLLFFFLFPSSISWFYFVFLILTSLQDSHPAWHIILGLLFALL